MNDTQKIKRKIAFFIPNLYGGGAQRVVVNLANEFASRGFDIDLVLIKKEGVYGGAVNPRVRVVDLNCKRSFLSLPFLIKYVKKDKPAVLLASIDAACIVAALAKIISGVRFRFVIRQAYYLSSPRRFKRKIVGIVMKFMYPGADKIIAISKDIREDLIKTFRLSEAKIEVVYNPVDLADIDIKSPELLEHECFSFEKDIKIIIGAGRLVKVKGFECLIKSFQKVKSLRKAKLIIIGEGNRRKELENLIRESCLLGEVFLPGFAGNPYPCIKKADVLVSSSSYEGFGNVIIEALACGTPVVSTDCPGGPSEILENGRYGKLVPVGDVPEMARAIIETLDNPLPPGLLRKRAEDFSVKKIADCYLDVMFPDSGCD